MIVAPATILLAALFAQTIPSQTGPTGDSATQGTLRPPALARGDLIGLAAPAGSLPADQVKAASEQLKKRGYRVRVIDDPGGRRGYLSGSDEARAAALNTLFRDPEVKMILCLRGGYGSPRLLDRLDYPALRASPKIIVGYSDITALLGAAEKQAGVVTFHGPMGKEWAASRGLSPFSEKYFWDLLTTPDSPLLANWGGERAPGMKAPTTLVPGRAEGVLRGGNLSVLCSLLGTPYEIDTQGAILFIEEVGEKLFRIDRLLNQLRLAGKLRNCKGILLGVFAGCETRDPEGDLQLLDVLSDYLGSAGIPVLFGYPAGHVADQATLPLGVRVRLDATSRTLEVLEPAVVANPAGRPPPPGPGAGGDATGARRE